MRVLVDSNVFINYLLNPASGSPSEYTIEAAIAGTFTLLLPEVLTSEFVTKTQTKKYLVEKTDPERVELLVSSLQAIAEIVPKITEPIPAVGRDPKDDYLLAYALVGQADYLVTSDKDLLSLGSVETLKIVTPAEFVKILTG